MSLSMNSEGFTIIEVLIVLAVTMLLMTISFIGQGGIREQAQFRDGMEQLFSDIERFKAELNTTVNTNEGIDCSSGNSGGPAGTNEACMVFAKAIVFSPGTGTYEKRTYIARTNDDRNPSRIDEVSSFSDTESLSWGIEFLRVENQSEIRQAGYNSIVFSRSIANGQLETRVMPQSSIGLVNSYSNDEYKRRLNFLFEDQGGMQMQVIVNDQLNVLEKEIL